MSELLEELKEKSRLLTAQRKRRWPASSLRD